MLMESTTDYKMTSVITTGTDSMTVTNSMTVESTTDYKHQIKVYTEIFELTMVLT